MISFIIIGRNEGWKLSKCIQSIIELIEYNEIEVFEILYVDSSSTDDSIQRANVFGIVRIFKLIGDMNAAIARNVGAKEAKGDVFFFIDGDMEINKEGVMDLFEDNMNLKYDFISGDFENYNYRSKDSKEVLDRELYHNISEIKRESITGGLFAINRDKWLSVNGMKDIFRTGEDIDLGLRLSKNGVYLYRLPINLAIHHTIDYRSKRLWNQLKDDTHLYSRSLLYRKNILNINALKLLVKQDYSLLFLVVMIIVSILLKKAEILLLYFVVLIVRSMLKKNIKYFIYFLIRDLKVLAGIFFFHPKKNKVNCDVIN